MNSKVMFNPFMKGIFKMLLYKLAKKGTKTHITLFKS